MGKEVNEEKTYNKLVRSTKKYFKNAGFEKAVFGLSGGIDSAMAAFVLADALGSTNVTAIHMPLSTGASVADFKDAAIISMLTGINFLVFPVGTPCEYFNHTPWKQSRLAKANNQARARMTVLYSFANSKQALVIGTSNRTERILGYFTKHGDGAADILPLAYLYKTDLIELAKWLKMPSKIIKKKPTAGLWRGQTDEKEIGLSYAKIDSILKAKFEKKYSDKRLEKEFGQRSVRRVLKLIEKNEHKREKPYRVKL